MRIFYLTECKFLFLKYDQSSYFSYLWTYSKLPLEVAWSFSDFSISGSNQTWTSLWCLRNPPCLNPPIPHSQKNRFALRSSKSKSCSVTSALVVSTSLFSWSHPFECSVSLVSHPPLHFPFLCLSILRVEVVQTQVSMKRVITGLQS